MAHDHTAKLLAAAEGLSAATTDAIDAARNGGRVDHTTNIGAGDTLAQVADSLRLLLECMPDLEEAETQLLGAVTRYLDKDFA